MTDKLGALICWVLYLMLVHWVARPLVPFIIALLALALVVGIILSVVLPPPEDRS